MKTLLIDNESKHNDELKEILTSNGLDLEIASHNQIPDDLTSIELITLSGSSHSVHGNRQRFQTEFDLIQKFEKPLIGICFGFELIAYAFGIKLQKLDKKREGIETVKVTQKDNIFGDLEEFEVCETGRTTRRISSIQNWRGNIQTSIPPNLWLSIPPGSCGRRTARQ